MGNGKYLQIPRNEEGMIGIRLSDRIPKDAIWRRAKVKPIIEKIEEMKWQWAGYVARL